jgi:hypothetical protein
MRRANLLPVEIRPMSVGKRNGTFNTSLHRKALQLKKRIISGVEGFGKIFRSLTGTSDFFFGHNLMNICDRTRLTNSKTSWIDIQFASSKLTATRRGSSTDCGVGEGALVCSE